MNDEPKKNQIFKTQKFRIEDRISPYLVMGIGSACWLIP